MLYEATLAATCNAFSDVERCYILKPNSKSLKMGKHIDLFRAPVVCKRGNCRRSEMQERFSNSLGIGFT